MAEIPPLPEGFTLESAMPPLPEGFRLEVGQGEDLTRSAASGLASGAAGIPGMAGDATSLLNRGLNSLNDWLGPKLGYTPAEIEKTKAHGSPVFPTTEGIKKLTGADELDYEPQTGLGKTVKGVSEFVPGALTGGARTVGQVGANLGRFAVAPGLASEGVGKATEGTQYEGPARIAAAMIASGLAGKAISPNASHAPEASRLNRAAQVKRLEQEGIPVSPGERVDSASMRYDEAVLDPEAYKKKLEAVTRTATRVVGNGRGGTYETPIVEREGHNTIDTMFRETGQRLDEVAHRNTFIPDANLGADLMNMRREYTAAPHLYTEGVVNAVHGEADRLRDALNKNAHLNGGQPFLTGPEYQRFYSQLRKTARETDNSQMAHAMNGLANSLSENMERSIQRTNPADAGVFGEANRDYRNALVIQEASRAKNVTAAKGYITPAQIEAGASKIYGANAHQRGRDPFDWAPAAKAVLETVPNSGTAGRTRVTDKMEKAISAIGAIGGALAGHHSGITEGPTLGLLLGAYGVAPLAHPIVQGAFEAAHHNPMLQAYRGNQLLAGAPGVRSLPGLLTAAEAARQ